MAKEKEHVQEYRKHKALLKLKLNSIIDYDTENLEEVLNASQEKRIKKTKSVKITKYRTGSAHLAAAKEKRDIMKKSCTDFIKNPKEKRIY